MGSVQRSTKCDIYVLDALNLHLINIFKQIGICTMKYQMLYTCVIWYNSHSTYIQCTQHCIWMYGEKTQFLWWPTISLHYSWLVSAIITGILLNFIEFLIIFLFTTLQLIGFNYNTDFLTKCLEKTFYW